MGAPSYNLAEFFISFLSAQTENEFSFLFPKKITDLNSNCQMASLDIKSLFKNIHLKGNIPLRYDKWSILNKS